MANAAAYARRAVRPPLFYHVMRRPARRCGRLSRPSDDDCSCRAGRSVQTARSSHWLWRKDISVDGRREWE